MLLNIGLVWPARPIPCLLFYYQKGRGRIVELAQLARPIPNIIGICLSYTTILYFILLKELTYVDTLVVDQTRSHLSHIVSHSVHQEHSQRNKSK